MLKRLLMAAALVAVAMPAESANVAWPGTPGATTEPPEVTGILPARARPGDSATEILPRSDAATLDALLSAAGLRVAQVRSGASAVPRLYVEAMPTDMAEIDQAAERKRIFIKVMLPLVLAANERLIADRAEIAYLASRLEMGESLTGAEARWLSAMLELFYVEDGDLDELLARVDVIPPSLALAQAAQESGWGTSRFAHEGNAVFGQRTWEEGAGLDPEGLNDPDFEVRAFNGLKDSVFAYLVNLNRHPAYGHLREMRAQMRIEGIEPDGMTLAAGLDDYAEEADYIGKIRALITVNNLTDFDGARLADLAD
jgi:Bax protein